ncbi:hypothetical protein LguiA_022020 [Lonicera macranthoides]
MVAHSPLVNNGLSQLCPWAELANRSVFVKPESLSEASLQICKNYSYFRVNYLSLIATVFAFCLLTHPLSLIVLVFLFARSIVYLRRFESTVIAMRKIGPMERYCGVGLVHKEYEGRRLCSDKGLSKSGGGDDNGEENVFSG